MNAEQVFEIILQQASIWGPALTSVIAIVAGVVSGISKMTNAISDSKKAIDELKNDQAFSQLASEVRTLAAKNEKLVAINKSLLDEIKRIKGYSDFLLDEEEEQ